MNPWLHPRFFWSNYTAHAKLAGNASLNDRRYVFESSFSSKRCRSSWGLAAKACVLILVSAATWCAPLPVCAALVLDDFVEPVAISYASHPNAYVDSDNVGDLLAQRSVRVFGGATAPTATLDVGTTSASAMNLELSALNRTNSLTPIVAFQFNYAFVENGQPAFADLSEGGANDALAFDFQALAGARRPTFLRAIVTDDGLGGTSTYEARLASPPLSAAPTTLVIPQSLFTSRGGGAGTPNFSAVRSVNFDFFFLGGEDPVEWSATLDRIRVTSVPEPESALIGAVLFTAAVFAGSKNPLLILARPISLWLKADSCWLTALPEYIGGANLTDRGLTPPARRSGGGSARRVGAPPA